jgi:hypothetical protein
LEELDLRPRSTIHALCVAGLVLAAAVTGQATEIRLVVDRPLDPSPGNLTSPVTLRFTAAATDSCATASTCRTRSAIVVQVSPCPPAASGCVGSKALYVENRLQVSDFDPIRIEVLPDVDYTVSGQWTLEQFRDGGDACDLRVCNYSQDFERSFRLDDLVGARPASWSTLKSRW